MGYPQTPFDDNFNIKILIKSHADTSNNQVDNDSNLKLNELLKWLCSTPKFSSYRVNTLKSSVDDVLIYLRDQLLMMTNIPIDIQLCQHLPEVILIRSVNVNNLDLEVKPSEVIVDVYCAASVLRGAPIFAPGIIGMQSGIKIGDNVSIYADLKNKCRKGYQKEFISKEKIFLGNGIAKMTRSHLFGRDLNPRGIAVQIHSNISGCIKPEINGLPVGSCLLQNLPSIICVHILNPEPGEIILDMCASPGNKTTHIAALMNNKGTLIAIDKTSNKIRQLESACANFHVNNVHIYQADSTKLFNAKIDISAVSTGPPFGKECFDRILLDAPCSALGKRPLLSNNKSERELKSFIPLQRKMFENAVYLLKSNGRLVYSTCTITIAENECLVAWALDTFKCLKLVRGEPHLGGKGWKTSGLSNFDLENVQRFDHDGAIDSIGFFIACFVKESSV